MSTSEFEKALKKLEVVAKEKQCVIMCAEAIPWRCHRSLVADALTLRKWKVFHIQSKRTAKRHERTSFSRVKHGVLTYPKEIA
jgi:uncharacterized protein (DUF488 family)